MHGSLNAGKEDVIAAINTSFGDIWFRAADLMAYLESVERKTAYFDVMGVLDEMVRRGDIETDRSHFWFRLKKRRNSIEKGEIVVSS